MIVSRMNSKEGVPSRSRQAYRERIGVITPLQKWTEFLGMGEMLEKDDCFAFTWRQ